MLLAHVSRAAVNVKTHINWKLRVGKVETMMADNYRVTVQTVGDGQSTDHFSMHIIETVIEMVFLYSKVFVYNRHIVPFCGN